MLVHQPTHPSIAANGLHSSEPLARDDTGQRRNKGFWGLRLAGEVKSVAAEPWVKAVNGKQSSTSMW
jgi:hypothetical protein